MKPETLLLNAARLFNLLVFKTPKAFATVRVACVPRKMLLLFCVIAAFAPARSFAQDIPGPMDVNSFAELNSQRTQLGIDIPKIEARINELSVRTDTTYLVNSLRTIKNSIDNYQKALEDRKGKTDTTGLGYLQNGLSYFKNQMEDQNLKFADARSAAKEANDQKSALSEKKTSLLQIENKINQLMIPKINQQNLMFWAGIGFVVLMCILLGTFYYVVKTDRTIRGVIFSGDSGIQFIALFSIIIAIILLGLTGILEGKELSALLGSVAGYILGKAKFSSSTAAQTANPPAPNPAPAQG